MNKKTRKISMLKLEITSDKPYSEKLVQQAITAKIQRLILSLRKTDNILHDFETRYQLTASDFINNCNAEDLSGGDADYVAWLGKIKLQERIQADLSELQAIEYVIK